MKVRSTVPVDLRNPGQVLACLGLLEAAEVLTGRAEGKFTWEHMGDQQVHFLVCSDGKRPPLARVLEFVSTATVEAVAPHGWQARKPKNEIGVKRARYAPKPISKLSDMALPITIWSAEREITLGHWADGSSRDDLKLYAGNRTALKIACDMIRGIRQLWENNKQELLSDPFGITLPMTGSFNFDARRSWKAIDLGYSPNDQGQAVFGSPVVELLAVCGLEHARPQSLRTRMFRYSVWSDPLSPQLARPAIGGAIDSLNCRHFRFSLRLSGKNKVVSFAEEET